MVCLDAVFGRGYWRSEVSDFLNSSTGLKKTWLKFEISSRETCTPGCSCPGQDCFFSLLNDVRRILLLATDHSLFFVSSEITHLLMLRLVKSGLFLLNPL